MIGLKPEDVGLLASCSDPRLSPDGAQVVFVIHRVELEQNRYTSRVWVAATDGASPAVAISPDDVSAAVPRWSPDGADIAYGAHALDDDDAVSEIRVVGAGGGDHRAVCKCPSEPSELEWSPDGTRLA